MAGSSLSCAFPLQYYARHQQAKHTHACGIPACLVPGSWLLVSLSFFPPELKNQQGKRERQMGAWPRRQQQQQQQQCLAREGIDKDTLNNDGLCSPQTSSPAPLSCLLHSCSIPSPRPARLNRPCLGAHAQPRDWVVQQRVVSSPSALTPTPNFPIKSRQQTPLSPHSYLSTLARKVATADMPWSILFLLLGATLFQIGNLPLAVPLSTRAGIRGVLPNSHLRVACAGMRQQQGGPPFPCRHLPTTFPPGRFPYPPFPCIQNKNSC